MRNFIREARKSRGKSQEWLGEKLGVGKAMISKLELGHTKLTTEYLQQIAIALDASTEELLTGKKDLKYEQKEDQIGLNDGRYAGTPFNRPASDMLKVFGYANACGDSTIINDPDAPVTWTDEIPRPPHLNRVAEAFVVTIFGHSMEPRYWHGERAYVTPAYPAKEKDCLVLKRDGTAIVKTFIKSEGQKVYLRQYNPNKEIELSFDEIERLYTIDGRP